jgi:mono/diheme cytochrome c family protein
MKRLVALSLGLLTAGVLSTMAVADTDTERKGSIQKGAAHYRIFCINCHGVEVDGNGPLTELLKIKPANLTTLARSLKEGETIATRVFNAVDGRHQVGEGQERKMPTFNDNLEVRTVIEISAFIEAVQK